jgi:hypothetical protein
MNEGKAHSFLRIDLLVAADRTDLPVVVDQGKGVADHLVAEEASNQEREEERHKVSFVLEELHRKEKIVLEEHRSLHSR